MWLCVIAFCPGWRKNGAIHIPALINSFHNGGVAYASSSAPLGYAKALVCHTTPPVCCLLFGGYPFAVIGGVVPVCIEAFYCKTIGITVRDCPISESREIVLPLSAYFDAAPAVIRIILATGVKAPVFDAAPYLKQPGSGLAVLCVFPISFRGCLSQKATAGFYISGAQAHCSSYCHATAVAFAMPRGTTPRVFGAGDNSKTGKALPGKVNKFHLDYLCFSRSDRIARRYRSELRYFGSYPSRFSCIAQARIHVKEVRV